MIIKGIMGISGAGRVPLTAAIKLGKAPIATAAVQPKVTVAKNKTALTIAPVTSWLCNKGATMAMARRTAKVVRLTVRDLLRAKIFVCIIFY